MRFGRHVGREEPEINFIPLIDVLLVILIFLMVTTTYSRFSELQIDLQFREARVSGGHHEKDEDHQQDVDQRNEVDLRLLTADVTPESHPCRSPCTNSISLIACSSISMSSAS